MDGYYAMSMGMGFGMLFSGFAVLWIVIGVPLWRILTRAGFSGWWILLFLVLPPIGSLVIVLMLAFAEWPARAPGRQGGSHV